MSAAGAPRLPPPPPQYGIVMQLSFVEDVLYLLQSDWIHLHIKCEYRVFHLIDNGMSSFSIMSMLLIGYQRAFDR